MIGRMSIPLIGVNSNLVCPKSIVSRTNRLTRAAYDLCQSGTQQSPIALNLNQGLSRQHQPDFSGYLTEVTGTFYNWGYGPAFTIDHPQDQWTTLPRMRFDNETVYLKGWHTHTPADHSVSGYRSKGEIHLVHVDESGLERVVIAVRLEPGRADTNLLPDLPKLISYNDSSVIRHQSWDPRTFLREVDYLNEYWTYKGSLTSPPCRQGIQWYVSRSVIYTGVEQMRQFLRVSKFSARAEQDVWLHEVNV